MKRSIIGIALGTALSLMAVGSVLAWPEDAKASLSSTPAGTASGGTWTVDVSFVSNGQILRVDTLRPSIRIRNVDTGDIRSFESQPTSESGVWRADIVFPTAGSWTYSVVVGGSGLTFDYPPVRIAGAAQPSEAPAGSEALPLLAVLTALLFAVAAGAVFLARRPIPAGRVEGTSQPTPR
jgi:hypothetical protein